ncbi:hypothetical protein K490DRAFT_66184 [Saccharata proteae CBS 121410]|uniref:Uncharacterized protein n=1 Tax=Saccharata proteae CBS 121410 TaxID=1314787 RepID=A0A9P4HX61_9PEZI|nr:hypothetical protein K490DRAFT_66184 [Saccharata proteae CBS 121410]
MDNNNIQDSQPASHATVCSLRHPSQSSTPNTLLSHPLSPNSPSVRSSTSHERLNHVVLLGKPAAALTTGDTSYDPGSPLNDIYSAPGTRGHQKSFSTTLLDNCRPLVHRATSSISSLKENGRAPTHSPLSASHTPDDEDEERRPQTAHRDPSKATGFFGDWFNGNSGAVNLGFNKPRAAQDDEDDEDDSHSDTSSDIGSDSDISDTPSPNPSDPFDRMDPISTDAPSTAPTMTSLPRSTPRHSPAPSTASKISTWFSRASNNNASSHARHASHASRASLTADPLLHLDVQHALFPHGSPDPLDPSSFNDLVITSTKLLQQYQSAYRGLSAAVRDARAEQSASRDEADEADTRARHLKMQLDGMAAKAAEQDQAMRLLAAELAEERQRRQEDEEARGRSLRLVKQGAGCSCGAATSTTASNPNRRSADATSVSDSGFESDGETALESSSSSVFSEHRQQPSRQRGLSQAEVLEREIEALCTPRQARKAEESQTTPKSTRATALPPPQQPQQAPSWKPGHAKRPSALDKVLGRKVSTTSVAKSSPSGPGYLGEVRGSQMDVWRENRELRDRVGELERSVDESLRVLGGYGF